MCGGKGRAERWLEVEEKTTTQVWWAGDERLAAVLGAVDSPTDFDRAGASYALPLVRAWVSSERGGAPGEVLDVLDAARNVGPAENRATRVSEVRVQQFRAPVLTVRYRLASLASSVDVVIGVQATVRPSRASAAPFRTRLLLLGLAAVAAGIWGLFVAGAYVGHHAWYATQWNALALWCLVPVFGVAPLPLVASLCLPPRAWSVWRLAAPGVLLAPVLLGQAMLAATGSPSLADAGTLAAAGNVDGAIFEAAAVADLGLDPAAADRHDAWALERLGASANGNAAYAAAQGRFYTDKGRESARALAWTRLAGELATRLGQGDTRDAASDLRRLAELDPKNPGLPPLTAAYQLLVARGCVRTLDGACVASALASASTAGASAQAAEAVREEARQAAGPTVWQLWTTIRKDASAQARLDACKKIDTPLTFLTTTGAATSADPTSAMKVEACARASDKLAAEEAAAAKREEARQRAAAYRPVRCSDGTVSPSCVCGGSWRGCCSHHGGVSGCM